MNYKCDYGGIPLITGVRRRPRFRPLRHSVFVGMGGMGDLSDCPAVGECYNGGFRNNGTGFFPGVRSQLGGIADGIGISMVLGGVGDAGGIPFGWFSNSDNLFGGGGGGSRRCGAKGLI